MTKKIFINLAVKDLEKSKAFYQALGFAINPQFTDHNAACVVISDDIYAMILKEEFFKGFITKDLVDAHRSSEVLLALTEESREGVDDMLDKARAAGGKEHNAPQDYGRMYTRNFEDPDGHIREIFFMDESTKPQK